MKRIGRLWAVLTLLISAQIVQAQALSDLTDLHGTLQLVSRSPDKFLVTLSSAPELVSPGNPMVMLAFYQGTRHDGGSGTSYLPGEKAIRISFGNFGIPSQPRDLVLFIDMNGDYLPQNGEPQTTVKGMDPAQLAAGVSFQLTVPVKVAALPVTQPQSPRVSPPGALPAVDDPTGTVDIRLGPAGQAGDRMEVVLNRLPRDLAPAPRSLAVQWTVYGRGTFTTSVPLVPDQFRYEVFVPSEVKTQLDQFVVFLDARNTNGPDGQTQSWPLPGVTFAGIRAGLRFTVPWTNPQSATWPADESNASLAVKYPGYQDLDALAPLTKLQALVGRWARIDAPEVQVEFSVSPTKVAVQGSTKLSSFFVYRFNTEPRPDPRGVLPPKDKTVGLQVWNRTKGGGDASPNDKGKVIALWFSDLQVSFQVGFDKEGRLVITEDGVHVPDSRLYSDFASRYNQVNPGKHRNNVGVFVRQTSPRSSQ